MTVTTPNILYLHSHDTGRYVQPYGHQVPTPNIQRLADQGVLFRQAFCAAPTCSGSRAALLTGEYATRTGCSASPTAAIGSPTTATTSCTRCARPATGRR